jgi:photosystem II stability/assembly factor-like uncharacterized protein
MFVTLFSKKSKTKNIFLGILSISLLSSLTFSAATASEAGWRLLSGSCSCSYIAMTPDGSTIIGGEATGWVGGGRLMTSKDFGNTWTIRDTYRYWTGVATSSDGVRLVAVAQDSQIMTSADSGKTWSAHETKRPWLGVASSSDGSKLVAIVEPGLIYTSNDYGVTWSAHGSTLY